MNQEQDPKEPILREEYERRHQALQDKYEVFARRNQRALITIVLGVFLVALSSAYLLRENRERTRDINSSLVENCEQTGNPLRAAVRQFGETLIGQTERNIEQNKTFEKTGTFAEIFPGYPPDKLHKLLVEGRENEHEEVAELQEATAKTHPLNCETRFRHP